MLAFAEEARRANLEAAEARAMALLDRIEELGLIAAGRTEREVEQDIMRLAETEFGIEKHWHKRIVRAGPNTLAIARDNPPIATILANDIVFLDLGPVVEEWEADVGRTYVLGNDPDKHRLVADLDRIFAKVQAHYHAHPDVTGAELYAAAVAEAKAAGWHFGGEIAGHLVAEFPHARLPGDKQHGRIGPNNPTRMRDLDGNGEERHWILEIHLVAPDHSYGGFTERLL